MLTVNCEKIQVKLEMSHLYYKWFWKMFENILKDVWKYKYFCYPYVMCFMCYLMWLIQCQTERGIQECLRHHTIRWQSVCMCESQGVHVHSHKKMWCRSLDFVNSELRLTFQCSLLNFSLHLQPWDLKKSQNHSFFYDHTIIYHQFVCVRVRVETPLARR